MAGSVTEYACASRPQQLFYASLVQMRGRNHLIPVLECLEPPANIERREEASGRKTPMSCRSCGKAYSGETHRAKDYCGLPACDQRTRSQADRALKNASAMFGQ